MTVLRGLIVLLGVFAVEASAQDKTTTAAPGRTDASAIEQALIGHACRSQLPGLAGDDAYQACQAEHLRALRADFGRDLGRVSEDDRKALDSSCSASRAVEGRQAYLECLTVQLAAIRRRTKPADQPESDEAPVVSETALQSNLVTPPARRALSPVWIGVGIVTLVGAIGGGLFAAKARRVVTRSCTMCGETVLETGDLCPKCRREAADVARQAMSGRSQPDRAQADRSQPDRSQEDDRQLMRAREEELLRQRAREEELIRLQNEEEARQEEDARRRRDEEQMRQRKQTAVEVDQAFDPHAILGVSRDAGRQGIEAAYQEAQLKYAPEHVAHLGEELQEHYRRKADAVTRAYQMLTQ